MANLPPEPSPRSWYKEPNVSVAKAALLSLACFLALMGVRQVPTLRMLLDEGTEVAVFNARQATTGAPPVSSQLKLIVFDDKALASRKMLELTGDEWAELISAVAKEHPAAIVIDKIFGTPFSKSETANLRAALSLGVPVTVGAFQAYSALPGRAQLSPRGEHRRGELVKDKDAVPSWLKFSSEPIYGPDPSLEPYFAHIGHIEFDRFRYRPFLTTDTDVMVPLTPFYVGGGVALTKDGLYVNWRHVPLAKDGTILPNFRPPAAFGKNIFSLAHVASRIKGGGLGDLIKGGDIVFIAPSFATGSTDFKDTPLGIMPGSLVVASVINSVMTGDWLSPFGSDWAFASMGILLGLLLALGLDGSVFWAGLGGALALVGGAGISAFVYQGILMPWHLAVLGCGMSGVVLAAEKMRVADLKAQSLKAAFAKMMAPEALKRMIKDPSQVDVAPSQRVVTVIFIDIVGFSLRSEAQEPSEVFRDLKEQLGEMIALIHEHGGVVDKTLGDGILAFFGYRYDGSATDPDHADRAVRCAMSIQRRVLERNRRQAADNRPVSPVRIGINSEAVFIGNLGHEERLDFTIIGHGVNFAKRLEEACEVYRIMLSETTHRMLLSQVVPKDKLKSRLVMVKHHAAPLTALEIDPFYADPETLKAGLDDYRQSSGLKKNEERVEMPAHFSVKFKSRYGDGEIADISLSGMSVKLATYLARGMEVEFTIDSEDGTLGKVLTEAQLQPLVGQVRWGAPAGDAFVHGIVIKNLSQVQKAQLFRAVTAESQGLKLVSAA